MPGSFVRIKICGLTRVDEARACLDAGADWIGLNFHPGSPRFVAPARAREIIAALDCPSRIVGLFVNRPAGRGRRACRAASVWSRCSSTAMSPRRIFVALDRFRIIRAFRLGGPR